MNKDVTFILASSSPRRRQLLSTLGLPFTVLSADVDEQFASELSPAEVVEQLSLRKARAVATKVSSGLVIGSDTIVVLDGEILGKPNNPQHAVEMLSRLQGEQHTVFTGVAIVDAASNLSEVAHNSTKVRMRPLTEQEQQAYVATGEPLDKAGAYAIQGLGATLVEGIEGDYFTVVGLPLALTAKMLSTFGIDLLTYPKN
jgi:septum formation protein